MIRVLVSAVSRTSASLLISSVGRASGRRTDGWHRRGGFPSAGGGVGVAFGMFGGLMKRDPQQMARVPLIIITIVRNHRAALFVLIVFCTPCYGRLLLPVRFWLHFVRPAFFYFVCSLHSVL